MDVIDTHFAGLKVILPSVFTDDRGYFFESYNHQRHVKHGLPGNYVQDNEAYSQYGVLRGLHFQKGEAAQGKLVRVIQGEVLDVVVDLRPDQQTYLQHFTLILNDIGKKQLYVPPGFAHGYIVLSTEAVFVYKCTEPYNRDMEAGIHPHDDRLKIDWVVPRDDHILSTKDEELPFLIDLLKTNDH